LTRGARQKGLPVTKRATLKNVKLLDGKFALGIEYSH
jgi:hypothetical protein